MTLTFTTLPLTTNRLYAQGTGHRYKTRDARDNAEEIGWEANSQYHREPLACPVAVKIDLYWPDKRKRDLDNIKGFIDALTGILWEDDSLIVDLHIRKYVDREEPRVQLTVSEL